MLKQFFSLLKRYILPYRKYLTWALILNFLSQWLNVFSFMAIVPILNILFKIDTKSYEYIPMDIHNLDKDVLINNAYYFVSNFVATNGAFYTLAIAWWNDVGMGAAANTENGCGEASSRNIMAGHHRGAP